MDPSLDKPIAESLYFTLSRPTLLTLSKMEPPSQNSFSSETYSKEKEKEKKKTVSFHLTPKLPQPHPST